VQYVDHTGLTNGEDMLMPASVFSSTGTDSDTCWQTDAAGNLRSKVMSGEDWAGGVNF